MIIIKAFIDHFPNAGYIAWADGFKGLVVQGDTMDEVKKELWISLKVKIAYDYNLDISHIEAKEITSLDDIPIIQGDNENEFQYQLMQ